MRVLGVLGMLLAAAIVLVLMVAVGRSLTDAGSAAPGAESGSQKAYDDLKKDGDMDDPKDEMRGALKDL